WPRFLGLPGRQTGDQAYTVWARPCVDQARGIRRDIILDVRRKISGPTDTSRQTLERLRGGFSRPRPGPAPASTFARNATQITEIDRVAQDLRIVLLCCCNLTVGGVLTRDDELANLCWGIEQFGECGEGRLNANSHRARQTLRIRHGDIRAAGL